MKGISVLSIGVWTLGLDACGVGSGPASDGHGVGAACGASLCLDLTNSANSPLSSVNGAVTVQAPSGDVIIVIRTGAATVDALSAICTHQGCLVGYDAVGQRLVCPCHGSMFSESGAVIQGPAQAPLRSYAATLQGNQLTVALQ